MQAARLIFFIYHFVRANSIKKVLFNSDKFIETSSTVLNTIPKHRTILAVAYEIQSYESSIFRADLRQIQRL